MNRPITISPFLCRLQQLYQKEWQKLNKHYQRSRNALAYLREHTKLIDCFLVQLWHQYAIPARALLIAVGGYGRCELYPYSDIDILILLPQQELNKQQQEAISQYIGALWDIGLEVGHSVRTLEDCLEISKDDITIQTNILESRLIIGSRKIFQHYLQAISQQMQVKNFFEAKLFEQQQRYNRFQQVTYNLEPNIKESPGGLRDLHLIEWIAKNAQRGRTQQTFNRYRILTSEEAQKMRRAEAILRTYRITLHLVAQRREDRILFEYQHQMAERFHLAGNHAYRASEQLMGHYYRAARTIRQLTPLILQALKPKEEKDESPVRSINEHFTIKNNLLCINHPTQFKENPTSIFELFLLFQRFPEIEGIETQTLRALWSAREKINHRFRNNRSNQAAFLSIFKEPRGVIRALRLMNQYDVLGRYIPAFGRIVGQMQHDLFHVYTVDEHALMVLRNLRRFTRAAHTHEYPFCSHLMEGFSRPEVLYLAALFHDIAKGRGKNHSLEGAKEARKFCQHHRMNKEDSELIVWLVQHHLKMSFVAQKQDIHDPDIIRDFAQFVGDERHLTALYLLTVADIRGTSPKVWNAWKAKLLEDLYQVTLHQLQKQHPSSSSFVEIRLKEAVKRLTDLNIQEEQYKDFWQKVDAVYFLRHHADEIAWHTEVLHADVNSPTPIVAAQPTALQTATALEGLRILIYTQDQADLFARICHFFEKNQYSIIAAKIHTTQHQYALDSFYVIPLYRQRLSSADLDHIQYTLGQLLSKSSPLLAPSQSRISRQLKHFPIPTQILLQPDESDQHYTLSITAGDRTGLLSAIAYTLAQYQINIHTAKIMTFGEKAEDIFLISGSCLIDPKIQIQLEQDLLKAVENFIK